MSQFEIHPGPSAAALHAAFERLDSLDFADALWARRTDMWSPNADVQQVVANRLGWLDTVDVLASELPRLRTFANAVRADGFTDVVLLGMGGSSLAPEVLRQVLGAAEGFPAFHALDSVDPEAVGRAMSRASTTLFVYASKSGGTIEPRVMAAEAQRRLEAAGIADWGSRFVAITDANTVLEELARTARFRDIFVNPGDIGGRYSALSFFGMVPAALMGVDLDGLRGRARDMASACRARDPHVNPGLALGAILAAAALSGRNKLTVLLPDSLTSFGMWVEQLVAESTGKLGRGIIPIAGEHSELRITGDRVFVAVHVGNESPDPKQVSRVRSAGLTGIDLYLPDVLSIGAEFFRWEVATAAAGRLLDINPFDEPNVQQAKDATRGILDAFAKDGHLPTPQADGVIDGVPVALSAAARARLGVGAAPRLTPLLQSQDYFGLLAYLPPDDPAFKAACEDIRARVGAASGGATMFGYGPRYLHSTGQLHKGGPNTGVFVVVTAAVSTDLPIPGEPFSFGILETAQALGDFQSLDKTGRRALHLHLPTRDPALLRRVFDALLQ